MTASFNIVTKPWIPIAGHGLFSLLDVFESDTVGGVGGNPIQKIALYKLLFAISQSAFTPKDEEERKAIGQDGLRKRCIDYLRKWEGKFDLYGDTPFLQIPAIGAAREVTFGVIQNQVSTGNTIRIGHYQIAQSLNDSEKAVLLVTQMAMALGGKKTDNSVVLTPGYTGKTNEKGKVSAGKPGPSIGFMGLLHSMVLGETVFDTLWLNLLSHEQIMNESMFPLGLGDAPWECMPIGEDCPVAQTLKKTLMGRLVPLSRFCLLTETGMHFSEGISHKNYLEGMNDLTVSINRHGKKAKVLWANPSFRPWREMASLLAFFEKGTQSGFSNVQLKHGVSRAIKSNMKFAVWAGGLRVTSNAGEQFCSGSDDYVESSIWLDCEMVGELWFAQLKLEMETMSAISKPLYAAVCGYYTQVGAKPSGSDYANRATNLYWQRCEVLFSDLVMACEQTDENKQARTKIRQLIVDNCHLAYSSVCDQNTARQLDAWAAHQPNIRKYLSVD